MADRIIYAAFPAYELAAITASREEQITAHMPHNMADAFRLARREALEHFRRLGEYERTA